MAHALVDTTQIGGNVVDEQPYQKGTEQAHGQAAAAHAQYRGPGPWL
jgi:hypothetical protein